MGRRNVVQARMLLETRLLLRMRSDGLTHRIRAIIDHSINSEHACVAALSSGVAHLVRVVEGQFSVVG